MESHRENTNGDETTTIPTFGFPGRDEFQKQGGHGWSEKYNCEIINGYLAPVPLDMFVPEEEEEHEPQPSNSAESTKKMSTVNEGNIEELLIFFRLFKFITKGDEQYLLEMHEAKTGNRIERSRLFVDESKGKCKVGAFDLSQGSYMVAPVIEDPAATLTFPQHLGLSLQERLSGWTVVRRKRSNGKWDKFYYHGGKQFRSFVEVTTFIIYSTKYKRELKRQNSDAEAPLTMSSSSDQ